MPDKSKHETNVTPKQAWSQENITKEKIVLRKFIHPAIYVEKEMLPARKTSPLSVNGSDEGYQSSEKRHPISTLPESSDKSSVSSNSSSKRRLNKNRLVKKCTCNKSNTNCQCHPSNCSERKITSDLWEAGSTSSVSSTETQITVKTLFKQTPFEMNDNISTASLSLASHRTEMSVLDLPEKEERIKQWHKKKEQEQKLKKLEDEKIQKQKKDQQALQEEQKKATYKEWLDKKRQQEEKLKKTQRKEEGVKKKMTEERLKKQSEGEQMFQAWLNIKKKEKIEKKLENKVKELKEYEEKQKRLEESQKSFDEWLKHSKNKQKPVPLNQGLSSLFVPKMTYVNPEPWVGNLEQKKSSEAQTFPMS